MKLDLKTFLGVLRTETKGFSFGDPWRYDDRAFTCVCPIIRRTKEKRSYVTYLEAGDRVEVRDTGSINKVKITNNGEVAVYFRLGEIFKGATQERSLVMSRVVMPGETVEAEVVCVHASKPIVKDMTFDSGGLATKDSLFTAHLHSSSDGIWAGGIWADSNLQTRSWNDDRAFVRSARNSFDGNPNLGQTYHSHISNDDLSSMQGAVREVFRDVVEKMPLHGSQIGFALIDPDGLHSLDCFDVPESWERVKEMIAGKESLKIGQKDDRDVFQYRPELAKGKIKEVLNKGYDEKVALSSDRTQTVTFRMEKHVGEATLLDGRVIHLLISRINGK